VTCWGSGRLAPRAGMAALLAVLALCLGAAAANAATYPAGFQDQTIVGNLTAPTAVAWAPDGRIFIAEQAGRLKVLNPGGSSATTIFDISSKVNQFGDRGLLGLSLDKNFAQNGIAYMLYTNDVGAPPNDTGGAMTARLVKVTIDPSNNVSGETVMIGSFVSGPCPTASNTLDCIPSDSDSHTIGTVRTDPTDGSLWVSIGDGAGYGGVDTLALRSYDEQSYAGKILHIDTNGRGLAGHSFCPSDNNLDHVCTKLFAKGFRNPFRIQLRPGGGLTVGDVGWNTTEEVDLISSAGRNYGWPCYEGPFHTSGYSDLTQCGPEYAKEGTANADIAPDHSYPHNGSSSAVVGGPTYTGDQYPSGFRNTVFFGDYAAAFIKRLELDSQGKVSAVRDFATNWFGVDLEVAPDGNIAYTNYGTGAAGTGSLREIVYSPGNLAPTAVAAGNPTSGMLPLTVAFSSAGSSDPDNDPLTFDWDFGDGSAHSSALNPSHTYTNGGNYTAKLTVSDGRGKSNTATVPIAAGNNAPNVHIDAPAANSLFRDGQTIQLRGSGTDPQDGQLPPSAFSWHVILHHSTHIHPITDVDGTDSTSFVTHDDHDADSYYDITLTARDSAGLTSSTTISILPDTIAFGLDSSPQGAPMTYAGTAVTAPFSTRSTIGFATTITAGQQFASGGRLYSFDHWSDGGARAHDITIPATDTRLTAVYADAGPDPNAICYSQAILGTTGLRDYWRMGETTGTTFADSKGTSPATAVGGTTMGVTGAISGDADRAARFDGTNDFASANVNLSGTNVVTMEFWLKWNTFANNDKLAFELTPNSNTNAGGFLIDPNEGGGNFEISHRQGPFNSGYNVFWFARPSAAAWHHYVLVFDKGATAANELTAYVDGAAVGGTHSFTTENTDSFANSVLYFMSRAGNQLFGGGDLDEVALYTRALSGAEAADHYTRGTSGSCGTNQAPTASFTVSPNPANTGQTVSFNGSGSSDPGGSITRYEWDLDGNGTYETDTGSTATTSRSYSTSGTVTVGLRVTDNGGATATTTRTLTVNQAANQPPTASFTVSPNPAVTGQTVSFDGSGSSDPEGPIARYEWDLDGNGTYETDTGATPTTSRTYSTAGAVTVGLRVTDGGGTTATTTRTLNVQNATGGNYSQAILSTSGLRDYWRMGETTGTTFADSKGTSPATAVGGTTMGVTGAIAGDPDRAARFDGTNDFASANLNLSGTNVVTMEFWLKWNAYANNDKLAFEFTPNSNTNAGGFLIDPNESGSGAFEMSHRQGAFNSGYNTFWFARPSAAAWHHYVLVFNKGAAASAELSAYVDGALQSGTRLLTTENTDSFANSVLYFMSRAGSSLFGGGDLDEVAVYTRALTAAEAVDHYNRGIGGGGGNLTPTASFTVTPNPATTGQTVSFNGSGSSDPDGNITRYEWDLDGNGTYETDTGATATTSRAYTGTGNVTVGLRVTDNAGATATTTRTLTVNPPTNQPPTASFTVSPNPATTGQTVSFNGSGSSDPEGPIARYEWDLDGNGTYETDTGATPTTSRTYSSAANLTIGLRVTDGGGTTATTTRSLTVQSSGGSTYAATILATSGLRDYWRMGETAGSTFADSKGTSPATSVGGTTLGVTGAIVGDPDRAARFDGTNDFASASLNLSTNNVITVEFWLKWNAFANNDDLAFEFTPNSNTNAGGFLVDPNESGGQFEVSHRQGAFNTGYNVLWFARPSATAWHHYVLVLNKGANANSEITVYVDGAAVTGTRPLTTNNTDNFANSVLYFMSRGGNSLFGAGDLDEVAIYTRALTAAEAADHYTRGALGG
jgi:YD repeat-containing protein